MADLTQVIIDFHVFSLYDPKILTVVDNSNWLHIESEPAIIEITFPGSTKPLVFNYLKNSVNSFNSHNLLLTCLSGNCDDQTYIDLPDGIYTITVKGSPDTFQTTKYHLKDDRFQMKMDYILTEIGFDYHITKAEERKKVEEADFLRKVAYAHIRREDVGSAKKFFDLASDVLKKIEQNYDI
tara:strand:+ start:1064 stop:1609 length:546 start_codon:yes stop_codon:yes gene_type:complete